MTAAGAAEGTSSKAFFAFFASALAALRICNPSTQTTIRIVMRLHPLLFVLGALLHSAATPVLAHGTRGYALTTETTRWQWLQLAISSAHAANVRFAIEGEYRLISADGLPDHETGRFPSRSNPNRISAQRYELRVPARPQIAARTTALRMQSFGFAINGVPFDPGAAEFWNNDRNWQYEAMSGALPLGLDQNNAHVQPSGAYHYHGLPTALLARFAGATTPVLVGWAADGFPIYGPYGYVDANNRYSPLTKLRASWRIKSGTRNGGPGGAYDGAFVQDYEYSAGLGQLDECNGRSGVTPEFPNGSYHYVLTDSFPFIPRCFRGTPDTSFVRGPPIGGSASSGPGGRAGPNEKADERQESSPRENGKAEKSGPPPEALAACRGQSAGAACRFTGRRGETLNGSCFLPPGNSEPACRPAGGPPKK